jgi:hypothetical protein
MWLLNQNAILTKDNMLKRNLQGGQHCKFCDKDENLIHLFFDCPLAKYVWRLSSWVIRADCRPTNVEQFWVWCEKYMPKSPSIHMVGLAASCWAIWQARYNACFEKKKTRSPTEIICSISSFLKYWADLQKEGGKAMLEAGAEVLKNAALLHHPKDQDQGEPRTGTVLLQ